MPMDRIGIPEAEKESISITHQETGSNYRIIRVSPNDVKTIWPHVKHHVDRCNEHSEGELTTQDFYNALIRREMQLWLAVDETIKATMITQIITYPQKKILRIIAIAGDDMNEWLPNLPLIEEWALSIGCSALECWGRKGWTKVLEDWKCSYYVLTKDLKSRMH
jgi:hypothetical protein|tara:strand:- start:4131 stop:4622 length:492 start_codon:yes stop_codon:yes gene_type:complete